MITFIIFFCEVMFCIQLLLSQVAAVVFLNFKFFNFFCMTTCSTSYTYFGAVCTFLTTLKEGPDRLAIATIVIGFLSFIIGELGI